MIAALKDNKKHDLIHHLGLKRDEYCMDDTPMLIQVSKQKSEVVTFQELLYKFSHNGHLIHPGVSHTLSYLRQEFRLPKGRVEVRRVLLRYVICNRHNGPSFCLPIMPPWPCERGSRYKPFQYIGLDYLGLISIKESDSVVKMWIFTSHA